jgi:ribosome biogenesis SPOUT family RNA methylase Rps3
MEFNGAGQRAMGEGVMASDGVVAVAEVVANGDHLAGSTREINTKIKVPESTRGGLLQLLVDLCIRR